MVVQLVIYVMISLPLYHTSLTFQFVNIFLLEECVSMLKSQVA